MAASLSVGCVKQLPAAPTPLATVPAVALPPAPPPAGHTRLVVDVVDGPSPVQRVTMENEPVKKANGRVAYRFFDQPQALCAAAPCVVDIPTGNVLLGFPVIGKDALEVELVHLGPDPSVYRRTLSVYEDRTGGLRVFGLVAAPTGAVGLTVGGVMLAAGLGDDKDGLATAGAITLGASALLIALGIWALRTDAPTFRPGSANHFPLAPTP